MTAPFTLVGFDHVVFIVDDLAKALKFYQEFLGCQSGYSYPALGMEQVWVGGALIVLWATTHPGASAATPPVSGGRNVDHVCIATSPFDHDLFRIHCNSYGVEIEREEIHGGARGLGKSFYIRDPFENLLEIKGPPIYSDGATDVGESDRVSS